MSNRSSNNSGKQQQQRTTINSFHSPTKATKERLGNRSWSPVNNNNDYHNNYHDTQSTSRRSVSMIRTREDVEIFNHMHTATEVIVPAKRRNNNNNIEEDHYSVEQQTLCSPCSAANETFGSAMDGIKETIMQSFSYKKDEEDDNDNNNNNNLDLCYNDNSFHVLANLLVEFFQPKCRNDILTLTPEDRDTLERLLPTTAIYPFIEAVQYRLIRTPHVPQTPIQYLTLQCQELGLDKNNSTQNPILAALEIENDHVSIAVLTVLSTTTNNNNKQLNSNTAASHNNNNNNKRGGSSLSTKSSSAMMVKNNNGAVAQQQQERNNNNDNSNYVVVEEGTNNNNNVVSDVDEDDGFVVDMHMSRSSSSSSSNKSGIKIASSQDIAEEMAREEEEEVVTVEEEEEEERDIFDRTEQKMQKKDNCPASPILSEDDSLPTDHEDDDNDENMSATLEVDHQDEDDEDNASNIVDQSNSDVEETSDVEEMVEEEEDDDDNDDDDVEVESVEDNAESDAEEDEEEPGEGSDEESNGEHDTVEMEEEKEESLHGDDDEQEEEEEEEEDVVEETEYEETKSKRDDLDEDHANEGQDDEAEIIDQKESVDEEVENEEDNKSEPGDFFQGNSELPPTPCNRSRGLAEEKVPMHDLITSPTNETLVTYQTDAELASRYKQSRDMEVEKSHSTSRTNDTSDETDAELASRYSKGLDEKSSIGLRSSPTTETLGTYQTDAELASRYKQGLVKKSDSGVNTSSTNDTSDETDAELSSRYSKTTDEKSFVGLRASRTNDTLGTYQTDAELASRYKLGRDIEEKSLIGIREYETDAELASRKASKEMASTASFTSRTTIMSGNNDSDGKLAPRARDNNRSWDNRINAPKAAFDIATRMHKVAGSLFADLRSKSNEQEIAKAYSDTKPEPEGDRLTTNVVMKRSPEPAGEKLSSVISVEPNCQPERQRKATTVPPTRTFAGINLFSGQNRSDGQQHSNNPRRDLQNTGLTPPSAVVIPKDQSGKTQIETNQIKNPTTTNNYNGTVGREPGLEQKSTVSSVQSQQNLSITHSQKKLTDQIIPQTSSVSVEKDKYAVDITQQNEQKDGQKSQQFNTIVPSIKENTKFPLKASLPQEKINPFLSNNTQAVKSPGEVELPSIAKLESETESMNKKRLTFPSFEETRYSKIQAGDNIAKQQLLGELKEGHILMAQSVNEETTKFWHEHVLSLQRRIDALEAVVSPRRDNLYVPPTEVIRTTSNDSNKHKSLEGGQQSTMKSKRNNNYKSKSFESSQKSRSSFDRSPTNCDLPMVDVVAPADLPGGYHFEAEIEGQRFLATVPSGGVQQGETFTCYMRELDSVAIDIPVGYWKDSMWKLCKFGCCHPTVWNSCFCPLIALGQIQTRINLDFLGRLRFGEANYSNRCIMLTVIIFWLLTNIGLFVAYNMKWLNGIELSIADLCALGLINFAMFSFVVFVTQSTRSTLREKFMIREERCFDLEDLFVSTFCLPCTIGQMSRHTANYDDYEAVCCSKTGLPDGVRVKQEPKNNVSRDGYVV